MDYILKFFLRPVVRFFWVGKVIGIENIPKSGAVVIASNHESYFDFLCFAAVCPRPVVYLAGEVFFKKWWWRPLMKLTGQIRVDRDSKDKSVAINAALGVLKQGKVFGIFPEGTRSADGRLQKAFTGAVRIALSAQAPIIPVGMIGTYEIMSRHDKLPKLQKCQIKIGVPIDLRQYYGKESDKKVLEFVTHKLLMKKIAELTGEEYRFTN
jgi:1-acyl-sn-glycerol-3-phosphate acyltransferase